MNYSTAVMLINEKIRAVRVIYEEIENKNQKSYIFKTLDESISVNDLVIVTTDTRHKHTVVLVTEVDVDVDFEDDTEIKWVVSKLQKDEYLAILAEETKWIDALKLSEKRRKRDEVRKNLLENYGSDLPTIGISKTPAIGTSS